MHPQSASRVIDIRDPRQRLIEQLSQPGDWRPMGLRIGGHMPGPTLVVCGPRLGAAPVYDKLAAVQTLSWMRGTLFLTYAETLTTRGVPGLDADRIDATLFLASAALKPDAHSIQDGYWTVLRACTRLGMISGRGVPVSGSV